MKRGEVSAQEGYHNLLEEEKSRQLLLHILEIQALQNRMTDHQNRSERVTHKLGIQSRIRCSAVPRHAPGSQG